MHYKNYYVLLVYLTLLSFNIEAQINYLRPHYRNYNPINSTYDVATPFLTNLVASDFGARIIGGIYDWHSGIDFYNADNESTLAQF